MGVHRREASRSYTLSLLVAICAKQIIFWNLCILWVCRRRWGLIHKIKIVHDSFVHDALLEESLSLSYLDQVCPTLVLRLLLFRHPSCYHYLLLISPSLPRCVYSSSNKQNFETKKIADAVRLVVAPQRISGFLFFESVGFFPSSH